MYDLTRFHFGELEIQVSIHPYSFNRKDKTSQECHTTVIGGGTSFQVTYPGESVRGRKNIRQRKLKCAYWALQELSEASFERDAYLRKIELFFPEVDTDRLAETINRLEPYLPKALEEILQQLGVPSELQEEKQGRETELSGNKDQPELPYNKIGHVSDWEGTLRSYKAIRAITRFGPRNSGDIARIWIEERNVPADMFEVEFPMFLEIPELVDFVTANLADRTDERYFNYYVTHWDLTDSVADMWKLSPWLQRQYPTHTQMFQGVNIGMGWQKLLQEVRRILFR